MSDLHFKVWPKSLPRRLTVPATSLSYNLAVSAARYPEHPAVIFYGCAHNYKKINDEAERLAGYMQNRLNVSKGDRVLLYMQNSPQFVVSFYGILRADAVAVPVNPMNRAGELEHLLKDTGAKAVIAGQELLGPLRALAAEGIAVPVIVACYGDYADRCFDLPIPEAVAAERMTDLHLAQGILWNDALAAAEPPAPPQAGPDDWAVFPYSSGTTGNPKGCMHTHGTVMAAMAAGVAWNPLTSDAVNLVSLPLFHVTGMQSSMNASVYVGAPMVMMTRWDRKTAAELIQRYKVARWRCITTMAIDLINDPEIRNYDLSSLQFISGGGASMPEPVARKLKELTGLDFIEGYGLSETAAPIHVNPVERPKRQCLGIPLFDVDARIADIETGAEKGPGELGEIVVNAPQVFKGYWNDPAGTAAAFMEIDGKRFFRTGDIGHFDEEGYFFIVDRVKRMINASGYKVWPNEVESIMLRHPAIAEVCVVSAPDARRGETVRAFVIPARGADPQPADIIAWCRDNMAAYKCPSEVVVQASLPRSATGKLQWRELQDAAWRV